MKMFINLQPNIIRIIPKSDNILMLPVSDLALNSDLVREMNKHLGEALILIEEGCAANNAKIRQEMKNFFTKAEIIEKGIAKNEVLSLDKVKNNELRAIREEQERVNSFLAHFDEVIAEVEGNIRDTLDKTAHLLDFTPVAE